MASSSNLVDRLFGRRTIVVLAVIALLAWLAGRGLPDGRLHVYFLDVGQGDAVFVQAPDGRQILVDGGPSPAALLTQLAAVMPFWDRSIDLVVLTHPDADHLTGLLPVMERYRVARVLEVPPQQAAPGSLLADWRERVRRSGAVETSGRAGLRLAAGSVIITVLGPDDAGSAAAGSAAGAADDNNRSLVLRLDYEDNSFLLPGDAEEAAERRLLDAGLPLAADVLKAGHHGSRHSSTAAFVAAVAPRLAVIQVGAGNRFGHPDPDTLARLAPAQVLRTDERGRIEVIGDGTKLWVKMDR